MKILIKLLNRWKEILLITIFIRIFLFVYTAFFVNQPFSNFFDLWVRWDGPHYVEIAKNGYQTQGEPALFIVFYPLYPFLIKFLTFITQNFNTSAILVSTFFSFTTAIVLYELTLLDFDEKVATMAVWFLNIFPLSYFLQASYTESLFLTFTMLTIYLYRKRKFVDAGVSGMLSTITRVNGILLIPLLLFEGKFGKKNLITLLLSPIGFLIYLLINFLTYGEPFYFTKPLQNNWFKKFELPWVGINNLINFTKSQTGDYYYLFTGEIIVIPIILFFAIFTYFKIRKSYGIYMFLNLILFTSTSFIMSTPRYAMALFPIYIALGMIKNRAFSFLISSLSLFLLFKLTLYYAQGKWAY